MKNKTIQNINLQQLDLHETHLKEHEILIINKLKNLTQTYILSKKKTTRSSFDDVILHKKQAKWFSYFFYNNPINLLFSLDQFLFAISKHKKAFQGRKSSEFQQLLKEKKKIHFFYGYFSKKQLKRILSQSKSCQGYYSKNLFALLERRLDVVLYRSGLVKNISTARQLISHKKIQVNRSVNTSASYQVSPGDIISITQNKKNQIVNSFSKIITENFKNFKTRASGKSFSPSILSRVDKVSPFKKSTQKNVLKNSIRLLLTKIHYRTHLKINKSSLYLNSLGVFSLEKTIDELFISKNFKNSQIASFFDLMPNNQLLFFHKKKHSNISKNCQINNIKNLAVLKLKPSSSKQAKFFLSMCTQKKKSKSFISKYAKFYRKQCVQKNFLSVDRKPFIQNKITDSLNLLDMYCCRDFNYYLKNQQKQGKLVDYSSVKLENNVSSPPLKNGVEPPFNVFSKEKTTNGVEPKYKTQKQYKNLADKYSTIFTRKKNRAVFKKTFYKTLLQMHSCFSSWFFFKNKSSLYYPGLPDNQIDNHYNRKLMFNFLMKELVIDECFFNKKNNTSKISSDFPKKQDTRQKNNYSKNFFIRRKRLSSLFKLKFKKYITKKPYFAQKRKALRYFGIKPIHLEISYKLNTVIFLYSPQRLSFPFYIDVDLITRFFR